MRTYYLFDIDKTFYLLYKNKASLLYQNFYQVYKSNNDYNNITSSIYFQLINHINKKKLNEYIYNRHKDELSYSYYNNYHFIKNTYNNEDTKLIVNNTFIKIVSNNEYPTFFMTLSNGNNYFICDFDNYDYFWLSEVLKQTLV